MKIRKELDRKEWFGFKTRQFVRQMGTNRVARIIRFADVGGLPYADLRFWRSNSQPAIKLLVSLPLFNEEEANFVTCEDPRTEDDE